MGKSSLRVQTMQRLQTDGVACGVIDITSIGSHAITPAEWYLGIVRRLAKAFGTSVKTLKWWSDREGISPVQRLGEFIEDVLLVEVTQPIVVFIDEIDSVLRLEFKDDFFALIRACYNQRAEKADYQRLTFALLGVATPSDLIQDKNRTPFNIGRAIELQGFQLAEAQPLAPGLERKVDQSEAVLRAVLDWTGGQPFLTQKLCQLIVESPFQIAAGSEAELVEQLVRSRILTNWEAQDEPQHLRTIRDRLLSNEQRSGRLLGLYQQILQQGKVEADDSHEQMELRLTGLVVKREGELWIYNPVYAAMFNQTWLEGALSNLRPYAAAIKAWEQSRQQDESRLIRGEALRDAQTWAAGKNLGDRDYRFLTASQDLVVQEAQENLELQKKALEAEQAKQEAEQTRKNLEAAKLTNQLLTGAQQTSNLRIKFGAITLVISLVGVAAVGTYAYTLGQQLLRMREDKKAFCTEQFTALSNTLKDIEGMQLTEQAYSGLNNSYRLLNSSGCSEFVPSVSDLGKQLALQQPKSIRRSEMAGGLRLIVEKVKKTDGKVSFYLRVENYTAQDKKLSFFFNNFYALDDLGNPYETEPFNGSWSENIPASGTTRGYIYCLRLRIRLF